MASWVDRYTKGLTITTGDGKVWDVLTLPSFSREVEFNGTLFNFIDIDYPLIDKLKIATRTFPLEFYFVGENNLDNSEAFEKSARNPNPWFIDHPYYNTIQVQVLAIKFDDSELNVTKITCTAQETITKEGLRITVNPKDALSIQKVTLDELIAEDPIFQPQISDINSIKSTATASYKEGVKIIRIPQDAENYFNAFNTAISYIDTLTETPIIAMQALTAFINLPTQFQASVQDRMRVFLKQFDILRRMLIGTHTVAAKQIYQSQGACLLSTMGLSATLPQVNDYKDAIEALIIKDLIGSSYRTFKQDLDEIQSPNGGNPSYYIPSFSVMRPLDDIMNIISSSLFQIALAGRKQFFYVLPTDNNVIDITKRFYTLDKNDSNISELIGNNKLKYDEIALGLPKGKTIVYYI